MPKGKRTALEPDNGRSNVDEPFALNKPTSGTLEANGSCLATQILDESSCSNPSPPGLDLNRRVAHLPIFLYGHMPPHVLLNDSDHGVKTVRTETFESRKHPGTEEYFRFSSLVLIRVIDGGIQNERTKLPEFQLLNKRSPLREGNKHVVPGVT